MEAKKRVLLSWSGGKDSTMALYELHQSGQFEVVALLTTIARTYERVSHHGVRVELLEQQAVAVGVPLHKIYLPHQNCTIELYESIMKRTMLDYQAAGIEQVAFGDIFLADLRTYRERNLAAVGMTALFPLWHRDTSELVQTFIGLEFRSYLVCVDGTKLTRDFAGRPIDADLIRDLPQGVDPCGENGEFHSFVYDGPIFRSPVSVRIGAVVHRDTRYFADLLPTAGLTSRSQRRPIGP